MLARRLRRDVWCPPRCRPAARGPRRRDARLKADNPVGQWNRFDITVRGSTVKVLLNGKPVLPGVTIPGLPRAAPSPSSITAARRTASGPARRRSVQFRNVFIRELEP